MTTHQMTIDTDQYGRISGDTFAKLFSRFTNTMGNDAEVAVFAQAVANEHRTLQQSMTGTFLTAIVAMAMNADKGHFDGRNEQSAKVCQKIRDLLVNENVYISADGAVKFSFI